MASESGRKALGWESLGPQNDLSLKLLIYIYIYIYIHIYIYISVYLYTGCVGASDHALKPKP